MEDRSVVPVADDAANDWLTTPALAERDTVENGAEPKHRNWGRQFGIVAAGALVGGIAVAGLQNHASGQPTATGNAASTAIPGVGPLGTANGQNPLQPRGGPGGGGRAGEQRISGTVTKVGPSSVTVSSTNGTATYVVDNNTQIVRNGNLISLSGLRVGDPVFVHVYPSGSSVVAERILAGGQPGLGGPGGQQGPPPGQPARQQGTTTTET
jgi:hypothetical protein